MVNQRLIPLKDVNLRLDTMSDDISHIRMDINDFREMFNVIIQGFLKR